MSILYNAVKDIRVLSVVGMCKNSGKTTALGHLLSRMRALPSPRLGLTSIGRDGEASDVVTGTEKPPLFVAAGTLIATTKELLPLCGVTKEIIYTTGFSTPLGEVVILRALSDGFAQIAGPSTVGQLSALAESLFSLGAERVIVDGALGRRSLGSPELSDGVLLCTGASYDRSMEKTVADTAYIYKLMTLPRPLSEYPLWDGNIEAFPEGPGVHIRGAVTDKLLLPALKKGLLKSIGLSADDPSRLFISPGLFDKLSARGVSLSTRRSPTLAAVTVNPVSAYGWSYDRERFREALAALVEIPVINVKEDAP